jgi:hypothetical protein
MEATGDEKRKRKRTRKWKVHDNKSEKIEQRERDEGRRKETRTTDRGRTKGESRCSSAISMSVSSKAPRWTVLGGYGMRPPPFSWKSSSCSWIPSHLRFCRITSGKLIIFVGYVSCHSSWPRIDSKLPGLSKLAL